MRADKSCRYDRGATSPPHLRSTSGEGKKGGVDQLTFRPKISLHQTDDLPMYFLFYAQSILNTEHNLHRQRFQIVKNADEG